MIKKDGTNAAHDDCAVDRHRMRQRTVHRILHITACLDRGGIETWLTNVLRQRSTDRFEHSICTYRFPGGAYAEELEAAGISITHILLENKPLGMFTFGRALFKFLRREKFDVVHCHGTVVVGLVLFISFMSRVPIRIAHCHSSSDPRIFRWRVADYLFKCFNRILVRVSTTAGLACSEPAAEYLFGRKWKRIGRVEMVHCGIDLAPFADTARRASARAAYGIAAGWQVLGNVARFDPVKNHVHLVEIFAKVIARCPYARLCLVGDGPLRESVEQKARDLNLQDRVIFTGIADDVPRKMIDIFDAFALPSVYEGLPIALLEAQAAGLQCVISDRVSAEAILDRSTVDIVSLRDHDAWCEAVVKALDRPRPQRPGFAAMLDGPFDARTSLAALEEIYDRFLKQQRIDHRRRLTFGKKVLMTAAGRSRRREPHVGN
jgi:glycosyltransferase involved in cell wall biosynthesis